MANSSFFVSYTAADKSWAQWIAWHLEQVGYTTQIQAWDSRPGMNFLAWMSHAAATAERTLVVLSPAYEQAAGFTVPEWTAALHKDPSGTKGLLVPIRVADFTPAGLLGPLSWIDLVGLDEEQAEAALLEGVRRERLKPATPPQFPGDRAAKPTFPGAAASPALPVAEVVTAWNVPVERNRVFTGRPLLLGRLRKALTQAPVVGESVRVALIGMGGVGKTAVAVEYAYTHRQEYAVVWWVRAEQPESLAADLAALAGPLGLPEAGVRGQPVVLAAVQRWLATHDRWLVIFDNAEPTPQVTSLFPDGDGRLLVTSRDPAWHRLMSGVVAVEVWERDESVRFLKRRTGDRDNAAAGQLAEALGDLPLALEQAGAYCEAEQLPLAAYLDLLAADARELLASGKPLDYTDTVATTWTLGLSKAERRSPHAPDLLRLLAYLGPEEIPWGLLAPALAGQPGLPGSLGTLGTAELDRAVGALARFSLVKRTGGELAVHRLIQQVVRGGLAPEQQRAVAAAAIALLRAVFPDDSDWVHTWPTCQQLLSHALVAAGHAEQLEATAQDTAGLLNQVGLYFQGRAQFTTAQATYERALRITETALGPEHAETATVLNHIGNVLQERGNLAGAQACHQRALRIDQAAYGSDHPSVARDVNNLGSVLQDQGDLAAAKANYEQALRIDQAALGPDHPSVAIRVNNLGTVLRKLGDLAGAKACFEQALRIDEAAYGPDHPAVSIRTTNLAQVLRQLGDLAGAQANFERSLRIAEAALGPNHPTVAIRVNNLGRVLSEPSDLAGSRANLQRALRFLKAAYGPDHPITRSIASNLARLKDGHQ